MTFFARNFVILHIVFITDFSFKSKGLKKFHFLVGGQILGIYGYFSQLPRTTFCGPILPLKESVKLDSGTLAAIARAMKGRRKNKGYYSFRCEHKIFSANLKLAQAVMKLRPDFIVEPPAARLFFFSDEYLPLPLFSKNDIFSQRTVKMSSFFSPNFSTSFPVYSHFFLTNHHNFPPTRQ